jgi:hypothetical protein
MATAITIASVVLVALRSAIVSATKHSPGAGAAGEVPCRGSDRGGGRARERAPRLRRDGKVGRVGTGADDRFVQIQRTDPITPDPSSAGSGVSSEPGSNDFSEPRVSVIASTGWPRVPRQGSHDRRRQRVAQSNRRFRYGRDQVEVLPRARARSIARYTVARPTPNSSASSPIVCSPASCRATRCSS